MVLLRTEEQKGKIYGLDPDTDMCELQWTAKPSNRCLNNKKKGLWWWIKATNLQ